MQAICFAVLWAGCGSLLPAANQGTVLLPPEQTLDVKTAGIRVGHASLLALPGLESALLYLEFSPAVTVMEDPAWLSSVGTKLGWVARQNQAWDKMPLGADVLCPLEAELRGGTVAQHCLPIGRCARTHLPLIQPPSLMGMLPRRQFTDSTVPLILFG